MSRSDAERSLGGGGADATWAFWEGQRTQRLATGGVADVCGGRGGEGHLDGGCSPRGGASASVLDEGGKLLT